VFLEVEMEEKFFSLREQFVNNLNKEIQEKNFTRNEKELREKLKDRMENGTLF